jgi:hypothetical protein
MAGKPKIKLQNKYNKQTLKKKKCIMTWLYEFWTKILYI